MLTSHYIFGGARMRSPLVEALLQPAGLLQLPRPPRYDAAPSVANRIGERTLIDTVAQSEIYLLWPFD